MACAELRCADATTIAERVRSGSTYWGIAAMSGHLRERTISAGHEDGRVFTGACGDGALTDDGMANVDGWPPPSSNWPEQPLVGGWGFRSGPWYGDAASDLDALEATLDHLELLQTRTYLTAHEQGVFNPEEFLAGIEHFREVIKDREARLLEMLRTPHTLAQLVKRRLIYGKVKEPAFVYDHIEARMVEKHLERLLQTGLITTTGQGYGVI